MKQFYILCLFFLLHICIKAQNNKISGDTTLENAILWKINGNGLTQDSYLFGTMHLICSDNIDTSIILNILKSCKELFIEIVDTTSEIMPGNTNIKSLLGKWYYNQLKKSILTFYPSVADTSEIYRYYPYMYYGILIGEALRCKISLYEKTLMLMSKIFDIPVQSLETFEERKKILKMKKLTLKEQAWELEKFMDNQTQIITNFKVLQSYYQKHDITRGYVRSSYVPFLRTAFKSDVSKLFLDKRNALWLPRIEETIKEKSVFIAVGAAHLPGGNGLISLLRQKGYKLTPLY